jgi:hypothetical protein
MSGELSEIAKKASVSYTNNTILRVLVNAIPYIGSSMDIIFASKGSKIIQERIEVLLRNLETEMGFIEEKMVDYEYLRSEEFFDFLTKVIEASAKTRDRAKIHLYAKMLRGSVVLRDKREFSSEDYLNILIELTPRELEVASVIFEQQGDDRPSSNENDLQWAYKMGWKNLADKLPTVSREDLPFVLQRLSKSGLIKEVTGSYFDYVGGVYVITDAFRKLMQFLKPVSAH